MINVFLSSTAKDLAPFRQKAADAVNRLNGFRCVQMENWGAVDSPAEKYDAEKIAECDVVVLLLGPLYGSRPRGSDKSFTELEFDDVLRFEKPCLVFAASGQCKFPNEIYRGLPPDELQKAEAFRERASQGRIRQEFTTEDELAARVVEALQNWKERRESPEHALDRYLDFIIRRNTYLDPRGVMQARRSISLPLEEVFVALKAEREVARERFDPRLAQTMGGLESLLDDPYERALFDRSPRVENVDLAKAVREQSRVVILGEPGAGKTTLSRFIALQFAKAIRSAQPTVCHKDGNEYGEARLPILMRVADYAEAFAKDRNLRLRDFLPRSFTNLDASADALAKLFKDRLGRGEALVLLDGLDEVTDSGDRSLIAREIEDFVAAIDRRNRVIVTSLIAGYRESPLNADFSLFTLRELELEQIERFLDRWCAAAERFHTPDAPTEEIARRAKPEIDGITRAVKENTGVKRLASNPLMLTILALIHRAGSRLPNRRVELYELAVKTLLEDWQLARGIPSGVIIQETEAMQILAPLAFWLHSERPRGVATEGEVKDKLTQFLAKRRGVAEDHPDLPQAVEDFLRRVREHTGLLVERAPRLYGFMHLTFEEYFAAREVIRRRAKAAELIHKFRHQPRWEEVILLAIGFLSKDYPDEAAELIRTAILAEGEDAVEAGFKPSIYEDALHRDLLFAAQCIGDCATVEVAFRRAAVKKLIGLLFDRNAGQKYEPLARIIFSRVANLEGSNAEADTIEMVLQAMHSDNATYVRRRAAEVLGQIGSEQAIVALIQTLQKDADDYVRGIAASALGEIESEQAIDALLQVLQTENNGHVGALVASALGRIRSGRTVEALLQIMQTDKISAVRVRAASALGQIGSEQAVGVLIQTLQVDKDASARWSAASALGQIGSEQAIDALIRALQTDKEESIRWGAASALGQIRSERAVEALLQALQTDENGDVQETAASALGQIGSVRAVEALLQTLQTENDLYVKESTAIALGQIGGEQVVDSLLHALRSDEDALVRVYAASALGKIKSERAVEALVQALQPDNVPDVRWSAAIALGQIGSERAVEALLQALQPDNDHNMRWSAAIALGQIGSERGIEALFQTMMAASDGNLVLYAAWGLGNLAGSRKIKTNQTIFKVVAENLRKLLDRPGLDRSMSIGDTRYSRCYDVVWEALWNVCQKQGIV